jgi:hypothetical protein
VRSDFHRIIAEQLEEWHTQIELKIKQVQSQNALLVSAEIRSNAKFHIEVKQAYN